MKTETKNKKKKSKKNPRKIQKSEENKEMTIDQIKAEMESKIRQINQSKTEIEKITDVIIGELLRLHDYRRKIETHEEINDKRKRGQKKESVDLDYELANMNMIKKLLDLSDHLVSKREEFASKKLKKRALFLRKRTKNLTLEDEGKNGRKKILIVEDDATTASIISFVLKKHNYYVNSTLNAEDGLKMTLKEKPDLIILDIMLPGMDGFQLLSILKENEETAHIPVVLVSSLAGEHDILKGLEIGAEDYILKPFSPRVLHLKVKKLMGIKNEHIVPHHRL
jgi:CheY-like chemotaxis protein